MKKIFPFIVFATFFISCSPTEKKEETTINSHSTEGSELQANIKEQVQWSAIDSDEALLATALMAAPKESRENCHVMGYNAKGDWVTFKEGSNEFIVLVDDMNKAGFSASCYHASLEPFMKRGRELKAEGKNRDEIFQIRGEEIKSGELKMGEAGSTLHIYYGSDQEYDPETSEVKGAEYRYVVYLPFATPESTGLPIQPVASNHPWIMDPGTHRAHIMITPMPRTKE